MSSRASLNKVLLIGNLTRDPELRYTPSGAAVCTFGLATNRVYTSSDGTKKEETEFHKVVSWNKLGELCSQLLKKGRKVYVEGRLSTRSWETPDGQNRTTTEVVIDDMRILDSRKEAGMEEYTPFVKPDSAPVAKAVVDAVPTVEDGAAAAGTDESKAKPPKASLADGGGKVDGSKTEEVKTAAKGEPRSDGREKSEPEEVDLDDLPF